MHNQIQISLPDGSVKQYDTGVTGMQIAQSIAAGLARNALAVRINGSVSDLNLPIHTDASVQILTWSDEDGKKTYWHSSAHVMAEALESLFPGVKLGIGPPIDNGFYYDIDLGERKLQQEDLPKIEQKMVELARTNSAFVRREVSKADAIKYFTEKGDEYKLELIADLEDGSITFYEQGGFVDLCRGPHIASTKAIKNPKLLNIAGAFWRGDEKRPQLTRIYGITFPKKAELEEHLERLELAKQRDHRRLGKELELFTMSSKVGPGLPMWLPKGAVLREVLTNFLKRKQVAQGYLPVVTPHIGKLELYETSGHYPYYKDSQFPPMFEDDGTGYLLKPMNCPHHTQIYDTRPRSYRELPVRLAEFGTVYRFEKSGELGGLTRVRGFTVDDAHIFCTPDQVKQEILDVIHLTIDILGALDFTEYRAQISLRDPANPDKYVGSKELWDSAENAIREAAQEAGLEATEEEGEAAFYGPKIDFMIKDALGREWQTGTVQLDYTLPERFDLTYIGDDNQKHRPVMIHRAPFGSLERFIGVLIEHTGGNFPLWLAPLQVMVLPVSDEFNDYARDVVKQLTKVGIRTEMDDRNEKVGYKIRSAEMQKIPFMLVVGQKERESGTVAVREHGKGAQETVPTSEFLISVQKNIADVTGSSTPLY